MRVQTDREVFLAPESLVPPVPHAATARAGGARIDPVRQSRTLLDDFAAIGLARWARHAAASNGFGAPEVADHDVASRMEQELRAALARVYGV